MTSFRSRVGLGMAAGAIGLFMVGCSGAPATSFHAVSNVPGAAGAQLLGVAHGASSYVAVGQVSLSDGGAWTSADGKAWTQVATGVAFKGASPQAVIGRQGGFVAVGGGATLAGAEEGTLFAETSPDGVTWTDATATNNDFTARGVVAGGPGLVAAGYALVDVSTGTYAGRISTSTDGSTWTMLPPDPVFDKARVNGIASNGSIFVAVGAVSGGPAGSIVWTSPDANTWTRVADSPAFAAAAMNAIITTSSGFIAVGGGPSGAAAWTSVDGKSWTRVADDPSFSSGSMIAVAATGPGFTAVGFGQAGSVVWTSTDGTKWTRAADQADFAGTQMQAIAGGPETVIVGRSPGNAAAKAYIWYSP